jgi:D-sedoheptulose 7-phosphate isomerase
MSIEIKEILTQSILTKQSLLENDKLIAVIDQVVEVCTIALKADKKIFFCGNGGSAADAQHLAAELSGRFLLDRDPLYAEALHVNSSYMTSVANDYSFDEVYARLVKAKMRMGDVLIGISTSGNSLNIIKAMDMARVQGGVTVAMTGMTGGKLASNCDFLLNIPSTHTPRIQEAHITVGHIICELVEKRIFKPLA